MDFITRLPRSKDKVAIFVAVNMLYKVHSL